MNMKAKDIVILVGLLVAVLIGYSATLHSTTSEATVSPAVVKEVQEQKDAKEQEIKELIQKRDDLKADNEFLKSQWKVKRLRDQLLDKDDIGLFQCDSIHYRDSNSIKPYAKGIARIEQRANSFVVDLGSEKLDSGELTFNEDRRVSTVEGAKFSRTVIEKGDTLEVKYYVETDKEVVYLGWCEKI